MTIRPVLATEPVSGDPDDPAIWVNRAAPARSLLVATNKVAAAEGGALYVFGLDGKIRQKIPGLDRPNNVDVEYGLRLNGKVIDIAVVTERLQRRLRVYRIAANGLTEIARIPVFENEPGERAAPMGIALYKRRRDNAVFAIVGRKTGPADGYLWQYRLLDDGRGNLVARKARTVGRFSGAGEIEAIAVDDALGYVYYADETTGIRKYHADPEHKSAARELALFGTTGFSGDREGIGIYARPNGAGYIVCTDQIPAARGGSRYHLFRREGEPGHAHDHARRVGIVSGGADETDGIEITSFAPLGPRFPAGLFAAMNSGGRNFLLYRADHVVPPSARTPRRTDGRTDAR